MNSTNAALKFFLSQNAKSIVYRIRHWREIEVEFFDLYAQDLDYK